MAALLQRRNLMKGRWNSERTGTAPPFDQETFRQRIFRAWQTRRPPSRWRIALSVPSSRAMLTSVNRPVPFIRQAQRARAVPHQGYQMAEAYRDSVERGRPARETCRHFGVSQELAAHRISVVGACICLNCYNKCRE